MSPQSATGALRDRVQRLGVAPDASASQTSSCAAPAAATRRAQRLECEVARIEQEGESRLRSLASARVPGREVRRGVERGLEHHAEAELRRARERLGPARAEPEGRAPGLHRLRVHLDVAAAEVPAGEAHGAVGPRAAHHLERLLEAGGALAGVEPEAAEHLDLGAEPDAQLEAPARERVERGGVFRDAERMMEGERGRPVAMRRCVVAAAAAAQAGSAAGKPPAADSRSGTTSSSKPRASASAASAGNAASRAAASLASGVIRIPALMSLRRRPISLPRCAPRRILAVLEHALVLRDAERCGVALAYRASVRREPALPIVDYLDLREGGEIGAALGLAKLLRLFREARPRARAAGSASRRPRRRGSPRGRARSSGSRWRRARASTSRRGRRTAPSPWPTSRRWRPTTTRSSCDASGRTRRSGSSGRSWCAAIRRSSAGSKSARSRASRPA